MKLAQFILLPLFWLYLLLFHRYRAFNIAALRTPGPVLLAPNHLTWIDWMFLVVVLEDDWRFVTSSATAKTSWLHTLFMVNSRTFPVDPASPYSAKHMAEHLQKGGRLVLFPEGRMSRTGALMKLYDGTGFLLHKTGAKVVTCHLRGAGRTKWAKHGGWKRWFAPVTAHFSDALTPPKVEGLSAGKSRERLTNWLCDAMQEQQFRVETEFGAGNVLAAVAEAASARPGFQIVNDVTSVNLTYRRLMVGVELLAAQWRAGERMRPACSRRWPGDDSVSPTLATSDGGEMSEIRDVGRADPHGRPAACAPEHVGVLLPNVAGTPVVVLSLWAAGKVPAILNFSTGTATMLACAQLAGLRRIITSRLFVEKAKLKLEPLAEAGIELIYMEDVRARISGGARLMTLLKQALLGNLKSEIGNQKSTDTAVILFTSGSEGVPKGVALTHGNILANIRQMLASVDLQDDDRFFTALPLFHSFGLTVGTLLPLVRGLHVYLYPSPLHYRLVPVAAYECDATVLLATNTFLNGYARKAHPYDFHRLRYLFAGAEKVQEATAQTWMRQFGVRILEGYGATECSPVISVNSRMSGKFGSAGRLMPGMEWRVEAVEGIGEGDAGGKVGKCESGQSALGSLSHLPTCPFSTGRLFVRGPNIMRGYLSADANAKFAALGGWYDTGDIVRVDEERFVFIQGRLKRFAKISGEMVSLTAVEDALAGAFPHYGLRCQIAVLAVPDADKGERLIAVTNEPRLTLEEIRAAIRAKGLPNIAAPRAIQVVKEIPKLGTGKVNHRELQAMCANL
jgi:acyl-[acyl-carrier-protein]-phospholipid O-acyltransferase/long-chain-fatty-acid--[acyl-carrier-protein] ligase